GKKNKKNERRKQQLKEKQAILKQKQKEDKKKLKQKGQSSGGFAQKAQSSGSGEEKVELDWPFDPDPADHCETPLEAYRELKPVLTKLAAVLGKSPEELRTFDPYFCTGRVKEHLASLGFPHVHNERADFYAAAEAKKEPLFDVLITNPPYTSSAPVRQRSSMFSGTTDHVERLLRYCLTCQRPCACLMPNYVYMKGYFNQLMKGLSIAAIEP
ncbi:unnamed protein product, partial [Polarella glacialis]